VCRAFTYNFALNYCDLYAVTQADFPLSSNCPNLVTFTFVRRFYFIIEIQRKHCGFSGEKKSKKFLQKSTKLLQMDSERPMCVEQQPTAASRGHATYRTPMHTPSSRRRPHHRTRQLAFTSNAGRWTVITHWLFIIRVYHRVIPYFVCLFAKKFSCLLFIIVYFHVFHVFHVYQKNIRFFQFFLAILFPMGGHCLKHV
jgi:hypothetical protein